MHTTKNSEFAASDVSIKIIIEVSPGGKYIALVKILVNPYKIIPNMLKVNESIKVNWDTLKSKFE
jgi:hypothetical protein